MVTRHYSLVAMRLTEQLERVKSAAEKWKELDNALGVPTEGLVAFLCRTLDGTAWRDEYLGVNAAVRSGVTSTESGVALKGAGAQWPVGSMGQTVPYCFTNNEFTLSATMAIHEVPEASSSPISLIGARLNDKDGTALFQLSWTSEGNWNLTLHKVEFFVKPSGGVGNWGTNTAIRVTVQKNGAEEWFVYASGRRMYETDDGELGAEEVARLRNADKFGSRRISHFFFGAGDKKDEEGSHVTVADVLLHNDALFGDDLSKPQRRDSSYSTSGCRRTAHCGGGHRDGGRKSRRSGSWTSHSWQLQRGRPQRRKTHSRQLHCGRPHS
ncbi:hypothetical protein ECC02_010200 [Trypanosoma cruzi]|uniref:Trans-sialidase C-terminal domain-containing protein n=1 Tax=Trypanosoma cruzi TaxID=5693 RepID=A0A7J6XRX7_TRYCR|nr:hypothetical protein ECC02_010200 [Trypanosoma cruzi]